MWHWRAGQLVRTYSCKRATRRWTLALFFNLVDITAYSALVLWVTANPYRRPRQSQSRRLFLCKLGTSVTSSHASESLTHDSGKWRHIQACARLSGVITDGGSSFPQSTTKKSGDRRRRRCSVSTSFGTQDDTNMLHMWRVSLQSAQWHAIDMPAAR